MIEELYKEGMGYSYFNRMKEAEEEANKFKENCKRLEQENKELKEQLLEDKILDEHIESLSREDIYRSALEEINKIAEPRFVNGLNEEADLCNLTMDRIQNKINEVLR